MLRALGHGWPVGVVQFIKGVWDTGERRILEGSALAFLLARFALRAAVERVAARRPRLAAAMRAIDAEGWRLLALLRLGSPVPGPIINAACGVTDMSLATFLATSVVAVLPQTLLFVRLGRAGAQVLSSGAPLGLDTLTAVVAGALTLAALWRLNVATRRAAGRALSTGGASAI